MSRSSSDSGSGPDMTVLVVGLGHPDRGDDAVGSMVVRRLEGLLPSDVQLLEWHGDLVGLLDLDTWRRATLAIIVDAAVTDAAPGTVCAVDVGREAIPHTTSASSHALGLAETLGLARALDLLPPRVVVIAITGDRFGVGERPSEGARYGVEDAVDLITKEVRHGRPEAFARPLPGVRRAG